MTWVRVPKLAASACAVQYRPTNASSRAPCCAFSPFDPLSRQFQVVIPAGAVCDDLDVTRHDSRRCWSLSFLEAEEFHESPPTPDKSPKGELIDRAPFGLSAQ